MVSPLRDVLRSCPVCHSRVGALDDLSTCNPRKVLETSKMSIAQATGEPDMHIPKVQRPLHVQVKFHLALRLVASWSIWKKDMHVHRQDLSGRPHKQLTVCAL